MTWVSVYAALAPLLELVARVALSHRASRGKEDPARLQERQGRASLPRPSGRLVWIHAASVGESLSVLPVVEQLVQHSVFVLITTGTTTSANILATRLPTGAIHQYVPLDVPRWVDRFLDHWQPDAAVWVESEFWPNLMRRTHARGIPMALVNARLSDRSFAQWQKHRGSATQLLACFDQIVAQSTVDRDRLRMFLPEDLEMPIRNLKLAAEPLPVNAQELKWLQDAIGSRPVWLAASLHPGEDLAVLAAHKAVKSKALPVLSIVVPRHPKKADVMREVFEGQGLCVAQRSLKEPLGDDVDVYLADTMGELGLFYRVSPIAFIGGSLIPHGGQNPMEAARLQTAILVGPHMENFPWLSDVLETDKSVIRLRDKDQIAQEIKGFFEYPETARAYAEAAFTATQQASTHAANVTNLILTLDKKAS